jgi:hypothetical protein
MAAASPIAAAAARNADRAFMNASWCGRMADWGDHAPQRTAKFGLLVWQDGGRPATPAEKSYFRLLPH